MHKKNWNKNWTKNTRWILESLIWKINWWTNGPNQNLRLNFDKKINSELTIQIGALIRRGKREATHCLGLTASSGNVEKKISILTSKNKLWRNSHTDEQYGIGFSWGRWRELFWALLYISEAKGRPEPVDLWPRWRRLGPGCGATPTCGRRWWGSRHGPINCNVENHYIFNRSFKKNQSMTRNENLVSDLEAPR